MIQRGKRITAEVLQFSRTATPEKSIINRNEWIPGLVAFLLKPFDVNSLLQSLTAIMPYD
ncbi:MAG: hypothetical protein ACYC7A_19880 [Thermoanaerobaculia bacterium]